MQEEIKPVKRYELTGKFIARGTVYQMDESKEGGYVKFEDYEALRRSSISIETAKEMAEALEFVAKFNKLGCVSQGTANDALARFNAEKGVQG